MEEQANIPQCLVGLLRPDAGPVEMDAYGESDSCAIHCFFNIAYGKSQIHRAQRIVLGGGVFILILQHIDW